MGPYYPGYPGGRSRPQNEDLTYRVGAIFHVGIIIFLIIVGVSAWING